MKKTEPVDLFPHLAQKQTSVACLARNYVPQYPATFNAVIITRDKKENLAERLFFSDVHNIITFLSVSHMPYNVFNRSLSCGGN